jgi:hypothetical protein
MRQLTRSRKKHAVAVLLSLLGAGASTVGHAEVNVSGTVASIRIVTSQESISKILSAVGEGLTVRYRSAVPLDDLVSGTYSGSLSEVVSRLLSGYNYVIKHDAGTVEIVVLGRHGAPVVQTPPDAQGKSFAEQWVVRAKPSRGATSLLRPRRKRPRRRTRETRHEIPPSHG